MKFTTVFLIVLVA
ncbi:hypothetical protein O3G_MSEX015078, partial [Manduca sexta]